MKKKIIAAVLIGAMAFSLAACGSSADPGAASADPGAASEDPGAAPEESGEESAEVPGTDADTGTEIVLDGTWPEETVKIGFLGYDKTDEQQMNVSAYFDYLSEYFNIEMMYSDDLVNVEDCENFIQDCASAGCKAVIGYLNTGEEEEAQLASELGMYYWGLLGGSQEAYDAVKDDPYYLGSYVHDNGGKSGDYTAGYAMGQALCESGSTKIILATGGAEMGISMFVNRTAGFRDAVNDYNEANGTDVQIIAEDAGFPGTDGSFEASQASSLDKDYDAIASTYNIAVYFQPLFEQEKIDGSVKLATLGVVGETFQPFMESGAISTIVYESEEATFANAIPMILNAVEGNKVTNADGSALRMQVPYWSITDAETYDAIYNVHADGNWLITAEDLAKMTYHYNPDLTAEDFIAYFEGCDQSIVK